ncbi:hypothetical protein [Hahella ganghwensis]|uniref:hypothetical protein n=1 Tax=Hahella ganghwensis TaxID=286420 RepID=UPI00036CD2CA|nr:hypothetical protein [Hahella ganghwensis]
MGFGIGGFDLSSVASMAMNVASLSNPAMFAARCCGGGLLQAGEAVIQNLGEMMGLPQHSIDFAQGLFNQAFGNTAGAASNFQEAYQGLLESLSPTDAARVQGQIGDAAQGAAEEIQNGGDFSDLVGRQIQEEGTSGCEGGKGKGNFLQALAKALGTVLGEKAEKMMDSLEKLEGAEEGKEFSQAQAEFSADSQTFSMMSNLTNTVIKTIGEALNTAARKQ